MGISLIFSGTGFVVLSFLLMKQNKGLLGILKCGKILISFGLSNSFFSILRVIEKEFKGKLFFIITGVIFAVPEFFVSSFSFLLAKLGIKIHIIRDEETYIHFDKNVILIFGIPLVLNIIGIALFIGFGKLEAQLKKASSKKRRISQICNREALVSFGLVTIGIVPPLLIRAITKSSVEEKNISIVLFWVISSIQGFFFVVMSILINFIEGAFMTGFFCLIGISTSILIITNNGKYFFSSFLLRVIFEFNQATGCLIPFSIFLIKERGIQKNDSTEFFGISGIICFLMLVFSNEIEKIFVGNTNLILLLSIIISIYVLCIAFTVASLLVKKWRKKREELINSSFSSSEKDELLL